MVRKIKNVLFIDGNKNINSIYSILLTQKGYSVCPTNDSRKAIELYKRNNIDLVIVEYSKNGINGVEIITQLQKIKKNPECKYVIITKNENELIQEKGFEEINLETILSKPFVIHELFNFLE